MLYIHVPFCKQACSYCDFYFVTGFKYKAEYVQAVQNEIKLRKNEINEVLNSIYFGGGTPSRLSIAEIEQILNVIHANFKVLDTTEITLEANPDDLTHEYIKGLIVLGINRLSIGVQSFDDNELKFMHRTHTAQKAEYSVKLSQDTGIENISIDLIYGSPLLTDSQWQKNIQTAIQLQIPHISAYNLTIEPKTALYQKVQQGILPPVDEQKSAIQFRMVVEILEHAGFEHYEISNFALPNWYSRHNVGYWLHAPYLGIGPSAHSFDGNTRSWNVRDIYTYLSDLLKNKLSIEEKESLTLEQKANEMLMLGLRTKWGANLNKIYQKTEIDFFKIKGTEIEQFLEQKLLNISNQVLYLTLEGKLLADYITQKLIV
ncbi:MAG: radical SAM family heme chaperone HemW [Bacteroidia bacterium]|nr:radical SAM family heme chaperone HemW [Bacteroidia bacterium]MDW8302134.1 radical SAM family heme chaperone HemW [Bacteroidia bacterium]